MYRTFKLKWVVLGFAFCLALSSVSSAVPSYYIDGTSTATLITDPGPFQGWYRYDFDLSWNLNKGLSHWDVLLKLGCLEPDHLIDFDTPAGYSNGDDDPDDYFSVTWAGMFLRSGDPGLDPPVTSPLVKYEIISGEAGKHGAGTFSFYANIIPEIGSYSEKLVAKAGNADDVYGTLTGAYPSCNVIPEPSTLLMLLAGASAWCVRRKS